jgi:hypothetical protein
MTVCTGYALVLGVPAQTPVEDRIRLRDFLCAAGIHVAAKEEYARNTRGCFHGEDQSDARAVAPAHNGCFFYVQCVHHG